MKNNETKSTVKLLRNLRESSGNAWDDVIDVGVELAEIRGAVPSGDSIDAPNAGELEAARRLAGTIRWCVELARKQERSFIQMGIDDAEELCQMLHDSLRTADQLNRQSHHGSQTTNRPHEAYDNYPPCPPEY